MVQLSESHCHLTFDGLREDVAAVMKRAAAAGVTGYVTIAQDLADAERALALASHHPGVCVAAGIHPHEAAKAPDGWDRRLIDVVSRDDVCALGETGLDYHYDFSDRSSQMRIFRRQLEIAAELAKPVVIHCREAHADAMTALGEHPLRNKVVFHCFTGSMAEAGAIIEAGYWVSLSGVVTFKKSEELREVASSIPADRLLIETDAPYLSPEPVRGHRPNEPAFLVHTAKCVADQRGMTLADLAALTLANTRRFFGISHNDE